MKKIIPVLLVALCFSFAPAPEITTNPPADAYTVCKGNVGQEQIKYSPSTQKYYYYQIGGVLGSGFLYSWNEIPIETKESKCSSWRELRDE